MAARKIKIKLFVFTFLVGIGINYSIAQSKSTYGKTLTVSEIVDCDLKTVWEKWTTSNGLCTFLGEDVVVELKVLGKFEIYNSEANFYSHNCKILSYLPMEMLSFTWKPPYQFNKIEKESDPIWIVVYFDAINKHSTRLRIFHSGFKNEKIWQQYYKTAKKDWENALRLMKLSCN